jgi:hypothetical protein
VQTVAHGAVAAGQRSRLPHVPSMAHKRRPAFRAFEMFGPSLVRDGPTDLAKLAGTETGRV